MIVVFWLEDAQPQARSFPADALSPALKFSEELRARLFPHERRERRGGEPISHVAIQSELPQSVGPAGVSDPAADYAHYTRRIDPAIPLGRPSGTPGKS